MNTKLVSSIDAVAHSRLVTISVDALLVDVAKLLSDTQVSLVVVCDSEGAMVGVITKTNIVQQIGRCGGNACTTAAADVMTRDVAYCRPTDCLPDVLSTMEKRGFVHVPVVDEEFQTVGSRQCARCAPSAVCGRKIRRIASAGLRDGCRLPVRVCLRSGPRERPEHSGRASEPEASDRMTNMPSNRERER